MPGKGPRVDDVGEKRGRTDVELNVEATRMIVAELRDIPASSTGTRAVLLARLIEASACNFLPNRPVGEALDAGVLPVLAALLDQTGDSIAQEKAWDYLETITKIVKQEELACRPEQQRGERFADSTLLSSIAAQLHAPPARSKQALTVLTHLSCFDCVQKQLDRSGVSGQLVVVATALVDEYLNPQCDGNGASDLMKSALVAAATCGRVAPWEVVAPLLAAVVRIVQAGDAVPQEVKFAAVQVGASLGRHSEAGALAVADSTLLPRWVESLQSEEAGGRSHVRPSRAASWLCGVLEKAPTQVGQVFARMGVIPPLCVALIDAAPDWEYPMRPFIEQGCKLLTAFVKTAAQPGERGFDPVQMILATPFLSRLPETTTGKWEIDEAFITCVAALITHATQPQFDAILTNGGVLTAMRSEEWTEDDDLLGEVMKANIPPERWSALQAALVRFDP